MLSYSRQRTIRLSGEDKPDIASLATGKESKNDRSNRTRRPCRRLLLGHAGLDTPYAWRDLHTRRLHRRRRAQRHLSQSWLARGGDRDHFRPAEDQLPQPARVLLP